MCISAYALLDGEVSPRDRGAMTSEMVAIIDEDLQRGPRGVVKKLTVIPGVGAL